LTVFIDKVCVYKDSHITIPNPRTNKFNIHRQSINQIKIKSNNVIDLKIQAKDYHQYRT